MKEDIFSLRKCIHVKLKKDTHNELRKMMFDLGSSMQDIFNEFAELLLLDDKRANSIVMELVRKRRKEKVGVSFAAAILDESGQLLLNDNDDDDIISNENIRPIVRKLRPKPIRTYKFKNKDPAEFDHEMLYNLIDNEGK